MILAGEVEVEQQRADKAGVLLPENRTYRGPQPATEYASRGGMKLEGALEDFHVSAAAKTCLDIGASAGGFTIACCRMAPPRLCGGCEHGPVGVETSWRWGVVHIKECARIAGAGLAGDCRFSGG